MSQINNQAIHDYNIYTYNTILYNNRINNDRMTNNIQISQNSQNLIFAINPGNIHEYISNIIDDPNDPIDPIDPNDPVIPPVGQSVPLSNVSLLLNGLVDYDQIPEIPELDYVDANEVESINARVYYDSDGNTINDDDDNDDDELQNIQNYDVQQLGIEEGEYVEQREYHISNCNPITDQTFGDCPVCYNLLEMRNLTITRCGHVFHASCLFDSLKRKNKCPMCRGNLRP